MPKIFASSQDYLDLLDIKDGVLILNGDRFRIVLETTAVNFDLLSEAEQDAAIFAYANLVNSLDFPMQIIIRTRQVDISAYLVFLARHEKLQPSSAMRDQLHDYIEFVKQLVVENTVLYKRFYVVIPYWSLETQKQSLLEPLFQILPWMKKQRPVTTYSTETLNEAKRVFAQREEELTWQFKRLGIRVKRLTSEELLRFFYEIYNPEAAENEGLKQDVQGYQAAFVVPNLA